VPDMNGKLVSSHRRDHHVHTFFQGRPTPSSHSLPLRPRATNPEAEESNDNGHPDNEGKRVIKPSTLRLVFS